MVDVIKFALLGLGPAAVYTLLALGVVLIYRGSGVVNFAQAGFALVGAYAYNELLDLVPDVLAALGGVVAAALGGLIVHAAIMWPMRRSSALARVVATLGVLAVLTQGASIIYGTTPEFVDSVVPQGQVRVSEEISLSADRLWLFGIAVVLTLVLWVVYRRTRIGLATSAVAENQVLAASLGWSPRAVAALNWTLGAALAGVAGVLLAPLTALAPDVFILATVAALSAALVGGFKSFPLTLAGGLLIGILESETTRWLPGPGTTTTVPFLVIILVLVVRGKGLPLRSFLSDRLPAVGTGQVRLVPLLVGLVVAGVSTLVFDDGWTAAVTTTATFAIIALSLVVVTGFAGQISLAQYALAGIGALISGRLADAGALPFPLAVLLAVVLTVPVGLVVALPALRARGVNLAVATLGLAVVIETVVLGNPDLTGGVVRGTVVENPTLFGWEIQAVQYPERYAVVCLVVLAVASVAVARIRRRAAGRRLLAVRDNERAAASVGINVVGAKLYAFGIGAALAALGGSLIALRNVNVNYTEFSAIHSTSVLLLAVIGGVGFVVGALIAGVAAVSGVFEQILSYFFALSDWWLLILGVLLIVQLVFIPDGVAQHMAGSVRRQMDRLGVGRSERPATASRSGDGTAGAEAGDAAGDGAGDEAVQRVEPKALELRDVVVTFGATTVIDHLDLVVHPGEVVGLIGPNGAGKTTLIDVATGFVKPRSGQVLLGGRDLAGSSPQQRVQLGLTRSWQSVELFEVMTVEENLRSASEGGGFGAYFRDVVLPERPMLAPAAAAAVRQFELEPVLDRLPTELPYAVRRLVGIARSVATTPSVILLDEPVAGLDEASTQELIGHVRTLAREHGVGVLLIEHDVQMVMSTCDRVVAINFGKEIVTGTPEEVRSHPEVISAYLGRAGGEHVVPSK